MVDFIDISKDIHIPLEEVIKKVHKLFLQYQSDLTLKKWDSIKDYITEDFYISKQRGIQKRLHSDFDIMFDPQIDKIAPIEIEHDDESGTFTIDFQVNANTIHFETTSTGLIKA